MVERHVIFSSGAIGMALTEELFFCGHHVTYIDISGKKAASWPFEMVPIHQSDPSEDFIAQVSAGAKAIYLCLTFSELARPHQQWPAWQRALMRWAKENAVTLVVLDSLHRMGLHVEKPITIATVPQPETPWGEILHQLSLEWNQYLTQNPLPWVSGLASDIFGPYTLAGPFGESLFRNAILGKKIIAPSELDYLHSFSYAPDIARSLRILGERKLGWGQTWILPSAPPISLRQFYSLIADHLNYPLQLSNLSKTRLRMAALLQPKQNFHFDSFATFESQFTVESRPIERSFGLQGTPFKAAISDTLQWFKSQSKPKLNSEKSPKEIPASKKNRILQPLVSDHNK